MIDIVCTMSYHAIMTKFRWNAEKNEILARERGITFEEIVQRIESGAKVIETDHPNKKKYPNQKRPFRLQRRAAREDIPYQTLIGSVLHKYASGFLKEAI